jgi:hypothetical protein
LESQPPGRTNAVEGHVGRKFEQHNAERHELLAHIELFLGDTDILQRIVSESIGYIALIELFVSVSVTVGVMKIVLL